MLGHHIMLRTDDDRPLAPSLAQRRALARAVYRISTGFKLLVFAAADNHLHLVALCNRAQAGELARRLSMSLHHALDLRVRFFPSRIKVISDQGHLRRLFRYVLGQHHHHGIETDATLEASSLPELLGLRLLSGEVPARVREHLTRTRREDILVHIQRTRLDPVDDATVDQWTESPRALRDAAASTLGLATLRGRTPAALRARTALTQLLLPLQTARQVAPVVERTPAQVRRLRIRPAEPALEQAIRLQLALRERTPAR